MSTITTHVLDAVLGNAANGVSIRLESLLKSGWTELGFGTTDQDGRCRDLCHSADAGTYRLIFSVAEYFKRLGRQSIYPEISITFIVDGAAHYHIPLLLSDNSYTTYRGS